MNNKYNIIGSCAAALVAVALGIPGVSYCATSHSPCRQDCLNFVEPTISWPAKQCSNTIQDTSKADSYRISNSRLQAEQEVQRLRDTQRAELDRQRSVEIEIMKSMQQLDAIDAENRKRELEEEQQLLQSLTRGRQRPPVQKIRPKK